MRIEIQNQHGEVKQRCIVKKVVRMPQQHFLMLNKQTDGQWHLLVGSALVPLLNTLTSIEIIERVGSRAVAIFHGLNHRRNVLIKYTQDRLPYIHFDLKAGDNHLTMFVAESLLQGDSWPAQLDLFGGNE